jgi:DNA-directed RNA polymerase subunit E"
MAKQRACKVCNRIYEGEKCPDCSSEESIEGYKGRIVVLNNEKSELAQKLKLKGKGNFAFKTR